MATISVNVLRKQGIHIQKNETRHASLTSYKNQLKMNKRLNCKTFNSVTSRRNISVYWNKEEILDKTSKAQETKAKRDKRYYIKLKSFCTARKQFSK
jgi:hypothetical protein